MKPTVEELEQRLAALEARFGRDRRRLRLLSAGLGCLLVAGIGIAASAHRPVRDVVQTNRLEILDNNGQLVLAAEGGQHGGQLDLWTSQGRNVLRLGTNEHGGDFVIWNVGGSTVASTYATQTGSDFLMWQADETIALTTQATGDGGRFDLHGGDGAAYCNVAARDGIAALLLRAREGSAGVRLQTAPQAASVALYGESGEPYLLSRAMSHGGELFVSNAKGQRIVSASAHRESGSGMLNIADAEGGARFTLAGETAGARAEWMDGEGRPLLRLGASADTRGSIALLDEEGRTIGALSATETGEGRLRLLNKDGHMIFAVESVDDSGGRVHVMNAEGEPVIVLGYPDAESGAGISIHNSQSARVLHAGTDSEEHGEIRVFDAEGRRLRLIRSVQ